MEPTTKRIEHARKILLEKRRVAQESAAYGDALELVYHMRVSEIDQLLVELDTPGSRLRQQLAERERDEAASAAG